MDIAHIVMDDNWEEMGRDQVHYMSAQKWIINAAFLQVWGEYINNAFKRKISMVLSIVVH